ncbi:MULTISPECIES: ankyrin repeat domain-containing protein [unclassified Mesorhizobium]|uniref:ankyrin repeat domain-containing protein n=1 Tax=unclassified Mesorhizobium TaxID=325217 RepID=UPI000A9336AF|nr:MULTISPECIES: ankyrin repeat domain-containing protein [unclassified Mesorhizobium]MBN9258886.1 ankyrin repeat domain-containing protein [Mesorhizobium sp.]MBN9272593.1 ankyrin repeat domain-containing protein [Mesorhizobium sp.]
MDRDTAGRTALINATIDRERVKAQRLLESGADPNAVDKAGWSALHFAAQNCDAELVQLLVRAGAALETQDGNGNSPLWRAVMSYRGGAEAITPLLNAGANPDAANLHGVSPRSLASTVANYDTAKFFEA